MRVAAGQGPAGHVPDREVADQVESRREERGRGKGQDPGKDSTGVDARPTPSSGRRQRRSPSCIPLVRAGTGSALDPDPRGFQGLELLRLGASARGLPAM